MSNKTRTILLVAVILIAIIFRASFFYSSVTHVNISGDESIAALMAMGITQPADSPVMQAKQHPRGIFGRFPLLFMAQPYLFPVDSYLAAPFIRWLPKNAAGIRFTPTLLGLLTVILSILILIIGSELRKSWPGLLLILFPSAYLLLLQGAYGLPGYPSSMFFSALCIFLAHIHSRTEKASGTILLALAAGAFAGVACSGTILMLPLLATVGAMICLSTNWKRALISTPGFLAGVGFGMLPYFVAKKLYPGAHQAVTQTVPLHDALARLWSPTLSFTLPATLGIRPPIMPDSMETVHLFPTGTERYFAIIWLTIMLVATALCAYQFIQRIIKNHWPSIIITDIFVGISWMSLFLFVMTTRWGSNEFRYLMPLAWCFPFILAALYTKAGKKNRALIGTVAILLTLLNIASASLIMRYWSAPNFDGYFTDVKPAVAYMRAKGITHCYSSYFDAYVIDYTTNEKIICSQPFNERFYGWPLPYKELVDASTNVAYALGPSRRFMPEHFVADLEYMHITSTQHKCGKFTVHTNFRQPITPLPIKIPANTITCTTQYSPDDANKLNDGNRTTRWQSHKAQHKGMYIDIHLAQKQPINRITFYYDGYPYDNARSIDIINLSDSHKVTITNAVPFDMQPFEFINHHPIYGSQLQTINFPPAETRDLRIQINEPNPGRDWTIGEIQLYRAP